ncbi:MAG: ComEA family DNA-binding protein [Candidatus Brocadiia bacterium]
MERTRWFSLSRRELAVLLLAVSLALAAVGAAQAIDAIWGRGRLNVHGPGEASLPPARLNVNTARPFELATLPQIGPKTAAAIVTDRRRNGPFGSLEDLMRVHGIGPKTVETIRPHAMCAPPPRTED